MGNLNEFDINKELSKLPIWLKLNKLSLNVSKPKFMIFHHQLMTNKLSESLSPKFDVCTMSDNEGYNPTSEVCPKSTIRSLIYEV